MLQVILHSDHCAKKLLPWFDGMIEADEKYFKDHGAPPLAVSYESPPSLFLISEVPLYQRTLPLPLFLMSEVPLYQREAP